MSIRVLRRRLPLLLLGLGLAAALGGCVAYPDGGYYGYPYGYAPYGYPAAATVNFGWGGWGGHDDDGWGGHGGGWHGHDGGGWHH